MSKVLIADKMSAAAVDIFRQRGVLAEEKTGLSPEELKAIIGDYAGLVLRSTTQVTTEILAVATNLKIIGRAGIGGGQCGCACRHRARHCGDEYTAWECYHHGRTCNYHADGAGTQHSPSLRLHPCR